MSTPTVTNYAAMPTLGRRVRAYFAPVNRIQKEPTIFDPAQQGGFDLDTPPSPWIDLGWIDEFNRRSTTAIGALSAGSPGMVQYQTRDSIGATVSFRFKTWSKLTMALSAGSQHMNLIQAVSGGAARASGAQAVAAVAVQAGSTAQMIVLQASDAAQFHAGSMIAVDVDYSEQTGFVGSGVSAAYVRNAANIGSDVDYIRRVTLNVARVSQANSSGLQLAQPLLAGAPAAGMKVQPIVGFVDREGGTFFQEWSALFVVAGEQGDRLLFHYPRLQAMQGAEESAQVVADPLELLYLKANFRALPVLDANDGEQAVCFRSFLPAANTLL